MRAPSRRMPPQRRVGTVGSLLGFVVCAALVGGVVWLLTLVWWPLSLAFLGLVAVGWVAGHRRVQRIAAARSGESICAFSRSFDRRSVDPWVVRATYEHLVTTCGFPIRPDDRFEQDLCIEDLDFEAMDIARRSGRSLHGAEANPLFGKIATVRDLVLFLDHQPSVASSRDSGEAQHGAAADERPRAGTRG
jgi:hypothetical protein